MFRDRKFRFYAVVYCLMGLAYCFVCAGLESGQLQIIRSFITPAGGGWPPEQIGLPMTVGSALAVPAAFLCFTLFVKTGVRPVLIPCAAVAALGCLGLVSANGLDIYGGAASGQYWLFFLSLATIRCASTCIQLGVLALAASWFIRFRGRVLGLVTMGGPLFSAVGAAVLIDFIGSRLGGDHRPFYLAVAGVLAVLALLSRFLLRDRPEDAGLYPDGDDRAPAGEPLEAPAPLKVGQVLKMKRTWLLLAVCGAFVTAAAGSMGAAESQLLSPSGGEGWTAGPWLALGVILGLPASYMTGWLCDRAGAGTAGAVLGLGLILPGAVQWAMPAGGSTALDILWCLGIACLTGGVSTLLPFLLARAYGRGQYLAACRVLMPLLLIPAAAMPAVSAWLITAGHSRALGLCLAGTAALGLMLSVTLRYVRTPGEPGRKEEG